MTSVADVSAIDTALLDTTSQSATAPEQQQQQQRYMPPASKALRRLSQDIVQGKAHPTSGDGGAAGRNAGSSSTTEQRAPRMGGLRGSTPRSDDGSGRERVTTKTKVSEKDTKPELNALPTLKHLYPGWRFQVEIELLFCGLDMELMEQFVYGEFLGPRTDRRRLA